MSDEGHGTIQTIRPLGKYLKSLNQKIVILKIGIQSELKTYGFFFLIILAQKKFLIYLSRSGSVNETKISTQKVNSNFF